MQALCETAKGRPEGDALAVVWSSGPDLSGNIGQSWHPLISMHISNFFRIAPKGLLNRKPLSESIRHALQG